jgi:hypothetical protein
MGAVWMLARADVRRRLTAVVVLALLVGISGGAVLAAVAGARRTSSAMDRFERESRTATFEVNVGPEYTADQIRAPSSKGSPCCGRCRSTNRKLDSCQLPRPSMMLSGESLTAGASLKAERHAASTS